MENEKGVHIHMHGPGVEVEDDVTVPDESVILSDGNEMHNSTERKHDGLDRGYSEHNQPKGTHIYMHMMMNMDSGMSMGMGGKTKKMGMCPMMMKKMKVMRPDGKIFFSFFTIDVFFIPPP